MMKQIMEANHIRRKGCLQFLLLEQRGVNRDEGEDLGKQAAGGGRFARFYVFVE
jgi:hypothetical protein